MNPMTCIFLEKKLCKILEELQNVKITCEELEMYTFKGAEEAIHILKPKELKITLGDD